MSEPPVTVEELRTVDLFEELNDEQLAEWVPVAHTYLVAAGGIIAEQGDESRGMQLLLRGDAQASLVDGASSEPVGRHKAPTWMGAIAALTGGSLGV
ncbi:MAG TPA: histidine kinase, partial [Solirubrobacteraceae bacterium]|nr:histidine kinase [Solirubrobacteraceae bacterium]